MYEECISIVYTAVSDTYDMGAIWYLQNGMHKIYKWEEVHNSETRKICPKDSVSSTPKDPFTYGLSIVFKLSWEVLGAFQRNND